MLRCLLCLFIVLPVAPARAQVESADLIVYGGTSAGVVAAVQAVRMGKSAIIIEPTAHLGGLSSSGLGWTDSGNKAAIGGISREFYQRIKKHYDKADSWVHQKPSQYGRYRQGDDAMWTFEPKVAEAVFDDLVREHNIRVFRNERLDRTPGADSAHGHAGQITLLTMESGKQFRGRMFIDATYEGDLLAAAGVSFTVGRESNSKYDENLNGVQKSRNTHNHRFIRKVDPFVVPGDRSSGLVWGVQPEPPGEEGAGDHRVQAYCYRMCMSNVPENSVPFPKPEGYDEKQFELLFRNFEAGDLRFPMKPDMMPNGKTDTNNNCAFSTDAIGLNYKYPEASYAERDEILRQHERYQKGLMWTLANHPRVPQQIRDEMAKWGLSKDEFVENGHWPYQIYVREARRIVSDYVATEHDCRRIRVAEDSVGLGSYNMDSHNVQRYVTPEGYVQNEGDVQVSPGGAYVVSYRSIVPRRGESKNLLVPVCLSASHIAYGSIRMEPVFMILGQSAATAAVMAMDKKISVQDVDYAKLRARLVADGQVLDIPENPPPKILISADKLPGVVIDDEKATFVGEWARSTSVSPYVERGYRHDGNIGHGEKRAVFSARLKPGKYEARLAYTANPNRATNVRVVVEAGASVQEKLVNQRRRPPHKNGFITVARFALESPSEVSVTVRNDQADGHVVVDAVQFLKRP